MSLSETERRLLGDVLEHARSHGAFPEVQRFRLSHEDQRHLLDDLVQQGFMRVWNGRYQLTIQGLRACGSPQASEEIELADSLLRILRDAYRTDPSKNWSAAELAQLAGQNPLRVSVCLTLLRDHHIWSGLREDPSTGLVTDVTLSEQVLDAEPIGAPPEPPPDIRVRRGIPRVKSIEISGYRPFARFAARPGDLTVIIGANATGKSSLFDFLRFVSFAASNPLPPEIDPRSAGKTLFNLGGPERIRFALTIDLGQRKPVRYEAEISGPIGTPRVTREQLVTTAPLSAVDSRPFVFLDFHGGKGVVRDQVERKLRRPQWTLESNELALRRALDPTLVTLSKFQDFLSSWKFYSGFDVSGSGPIRRPVPTEPNPALAEDGANLSAVLFSLMTEHQEEWQELEMHLKSAIPGFQSINVRARGGPGTVMAVWRESGVKGELTLADLSDGTLRFLCWATLCLSGGLPPLVCIDEPELGLHPRVLPIVAGLFRVASARSQIVLATHSPHFLSQFSLDEVAVMRKDDGRVVFLRPSTSTALRREVEEIGGEALAKLHMSDELEFRV